jgi:hypothetical protein
VGTAYPSWAPLFYPGLWCGFVLFCVVMTGHSPGLTHIHDRSLSWLDTHIHDRSLSWLDTHTWQVTLLAWHTYTWQVTLNIGYTRHMTKTNKTQHRTIQTHTINQGRTKVLTATVFILHNSNFAQIFWHRFEQFEKKNVWNVVITCKSFRY